MGHGIFSRMFTTLEIAALVTPFSGDSRFAWSNANVAERFDPSCTPLILPYKKKRAPILSVFGPYTLFRPIGSVLIPPSTSQLPGGPECLTWKRGHLMKRGLMEVARQSDRSRRISLSAGQIMIVKTIPFFFFPSNSLLGRAVADNGASLLIAPDGHVFRPHDLRLDSRPSQGHF